jgi:hypothetical protein
MSGSGGFYKYRCKYFYSKQCPEWVYVNGDPCSECLVSCWLPCLGTSSDPTNTQLQRKGLDATEDFVPMWPGVRDICVPVLQDGFLQYAIMELVLPDASGYWTLRAKVAQPPPVAPPSFGGTAELPRPRPLLNPANVGEPVQVGSRY